MKTSEKIKKLEKISKATDNIEMKAAFEKRIEILKERKNVNKDEKANY